VRDRAGRAAARRAREHRREQVTLVCSRVRTLCLTRVHSAVTCSRLCY
jgi:hypothetical protein